MQCESAWFATSFQELIDELLVKSPQLEGGVTSDFMPSLAQNGLENELCTSSSQTPEI